MKITCGIYVYSIPDDRFLLCHATRSRNIWSIPKGLKDEGESSEETAFRELCEETGLSREILQVRDVFPLPARKYQKQNKLLESFLVPIKADLHAFTLKCSTLVNNSYPEIDKYRWVDWFEFETLAHESQVKNLPDIKGILNGR